MAELSSMLQTLDRAGSLSKQDIFQTITQAVTAAGYTIVEENSQKPWGGYLRFSDNDADQFVTEFFPGLEAKEARLGNPDAPLSPKLLIVSPGERLSWQYHDRRAERWTFLSPGGYMKSTTDEMGESITVPTGEVVQFGRSERHRLVGAADTYTLVAEIWQHTNPQDLSDEDDIVRLQDDYKR